jgi:hypothetical protein
LKQRIVFQRPVSLHGEQLSTRIQLCFLHRDKEGGTMKKSAIVFGVLLLATWSAAAVFAADLPAYPVKGKVVNVLACFDNPEGSLFSMDGQYLFVSNSALHGDANKPFAWVEGGGSISRLEVGPGGTLKLTDRYFIKDLTGPLGMAVLNVDLGRFPRGTIFATAGSAPLALADGTPVTDPSRHKPKIIAFDPGSGEILGEIKLCANSVFAKISGGPVSLVNALAFDDAGNLYVIDTGLSIAAGPGRSRWRASSPCWRARTPRASRSSSPTPAGRMALRSPLTPERCGSTR